MGHASPVWSVAAREDLALTADEKGTICLHRFLNGKWVFSRTMQNISDPVLTLSFKSETLANYLKYSYSGSEYREINLETCAWECSSYKNIQNPIIAATDDLTYSVRKTDAAILKNDKDFYATAHTTGIQDLMIHSGILYSSSFDGTVIVAGQGRHKLDGLPRFVLVEDVVLCLLPNGEVRNLDNSIHSRTRLAGSIKTLADLVLTQKGDLIQFPERLISSNVACFSSPSCYCTKDSFVHGLSSEGFKHTPGVPTAIAHALDKIAVGDDQRRIKVYDLNGDVLATWCSHNAKVTHLVWIDEYRLVSAALDDSLMVNDLRDQSGPVAKIQSAHASTITALIYDKKTLYSAGQDACLRTYSIS